MITGVILAIVLPVMQAVAGEKFKVVTTFTVIADIARNVAGDAAAVESITKPGADVHNYQPTSGDVRKAQAARFILRNGLGLEPWFEKFFRKLKKVPEIVVSKEIEPINITEGVYKGKPDPHAWMSPVTALVYVDNILNAFVKYDPGNAETYRVNAEGYKQKIIGSIQPVWKELAAVPLNKRWLVSGEGAFSYFARDFDFRELYLWPVNTDRKGTARQVRKMVDAVRENGISVVFSESTVSSKSIRQVAQEAGIKYGGVLYVDSLGGADSLAPTYLDLLKMTANTLARELVSVGAE